MWRNGLFTTNETEQATIQAREAGALRLNEEYGTTLREVIADVQTTDPVSITEEPDSTVKNPVSITENGKQVAQVLSLERYRKFQQSLTALNNQTTNHIPLDPRTL